MRKIKRLLIIGMLVLAMLVPTAMPVMADPTNETWLRQIIDELEYYRAKYYALRLVQSTPTPPDSPMMRLVNPSSIVVMPGEVLEVRLTVRNIGLGSAHSVLTQATTTGPMTIEFLNNSNHVNTISQNTQRQMTMRLTIDENAEPGTHTINLNHHFRNNAGANSNSSDTISVRVGGEVGASNVRLSNIQTNISTIGPDQSFVITADLQNMGTVPANNVQVSVGNLSPTSIFLTSDLNQAFFSTLEAGQTQRVSFTFHTAQALQSGVNQLDFRLTYEDSGERPVIPFFITALTEYTAAESANIEMRGLTTPTGRLNVSQAGTISFELVNTGDAEAHNIRVSATAVDPTALVPTIHSNRQSIQSLAVGQSREFEFGFMPTASSQTQSHAVQLRVEYSIRGVEESSSFVQYIALNVYNPDQQATPTPGPGGVQIPRMVVMSHPTTPQIPRAGQNFEMEISFLNTSPTRAVNNVRITLNAAYAVGGTGTPTSLGAVFTPVGGSNTLFISDLGPGEYVTKNITMFTIPDAAPRIYTLDVVFDFQDDEYVEHNMSERLSIPVAQLSRLQMYPEHPFVPPMMDMWGSVDFEFQVINTGRVNLRNSWVRIEGPFDTSFSNMFLSTLVAGRTITYTGRISPLPGETGQLDGAIVVFGYDDADERTEIRYEFSIYVMGGDDGHGFEGGFDDDFDRGMPGRHPGDMGMYEGGAFGRPGFEPFDPYGSDEGGILQLIRRPIVFGPALGVVAAAAIITIVIIMKRKKSKLSFEDDYDFN
ncbi:MAG: hypothetical protein FWC92_04380 [Defluviitaleaceae bacterium]|nr:hypothetical protein [Defluviitaleaceae bacterium]